MCTYPDIRQQNRPVILIHNRSDRSNELASRFSATGYNITERTSSSLEPIAVHGSNYLVGFPRINMFFFGK